MKRPTRAKKAAKSKVKNVTPAVYDGVQYKSTLEAYCAEKLTKAGLPVNYETWEVVLQEKFTTTVESFEPRTRTSKESKLKIRTFEPATKNIRKQVYTPDFSCQPQGWVIETKGLRTEAFNARWRNFKEWLHDQGLHHYRLYMPGNRSEVDQAIAHILATTKP